MNFTFSGGTAQQQQWVQDAIARCSYPLDDITCAVTVTWGNVAAVNVEYVHPYMTTSGSAGNCTITIDSSADDPNAAENAGLGGSLSKLHDFYCESFVHELGHVVALNTFWSSDTAPEVGEMCNLFRSVDVTPPLVKVGAQSDWNSDGQWAHMIRETVAEVFKCAFYQNGTLLYGNRTIWTLPPGNWS